MYCIEYPVNSGYIIDIDEDNTWHIAGKVPAGYQSSVFRSGFGTWSGTLGDMIEIWGPGGTGKEGGYGGTPLLQIREASKKEGQAANTSAPAYSRAARWRRIARPGDQGLWVGIAGKGGGEVFIGAEAYFATVISAQLPSRWFAFTMRTTRYGFAVGLGGGLSLVIATGIKAPHDIESELFTGSDWAVSIGERWGTLAKNGFKAFGKTLQELADLGPRIQFCIEHGDWLLQLGKGIYQEACLDNETREVTVVDTPVGGGLEIGYFWYYGQANVVTEGVGAPQ
ncbi:MAG TPA: hypothetical protein VKU01_19315 [Bryobacteraceae bacterium]|nr:hypothetical protein [Bryobacteraceae bacterium]